MKKNSTSSNDDKKATIIKTIEEMVDTLKMTKGMLETINEGIHGDFHKSEDFMAKHELQGFLDKDGEPDIAKIDKDPNITVEQVVQLSIYATMNHLHDQFHAVVEHFADKHGVETNDPHIEVITDVNQLPPDVLEALGKMFGGRK